MPSTMSHVCESTKFFRTSIKYFSCILSLSSQTHVSRDKAIPFVCQQEYKTNPPLHYYLNTFSLLRDLCKRIKGEKALLQLLRIYFTKLRLLYRQFKDSFGPF